MRIEGEKIRELLIGADREVVLCCPFIKKGVLEVLLQIIPSATVVRVVTRWRPAEVAAGVSDLDIFWLLRDRDRSRLLLLDALHAKLFVADDQCLVGSANLTATALGWCRRPNRELLMPATRDQPEVRRLLQDLEAADEATEEMFLDVERKAARIGSIKFADADDVDRGSIGQYGVPWLPRCGAPQHLYGIYGNPDMRGVAGGTRDDARMDMIDLGVPAGLDEIRFRAWVCDGLREMPAFRAILGRISARLTDAQGEEMIGDMLKTGQQSQVKRQWEIVRDWIDEFFSDEAEVAPENFVIRPRPR